MPFYYLGIYLESTGEGISFVKAFESIRPIRVRLHDSLSVP